MYNALRGFNMDICTKCPEEIKEHRIITHGLMETLFEVNNVFMKLRIGILKKYVG